MERLAAIDALGRGLANVRFLPSVPREQLADHLASADAFVTSGARSDGDARA